MAREHTVQEGDTFSQLARQYYGEHHIEENAKKLFEANKGVGGVGPAEDQLWLQHEGKPVVLQIPDREELDKVGEDQRD